MSLENGHEIYQKWHIVQEEEDYKVLPIDIADQRQLGLFIEAQLEYFGYNWNMLERQEDLTKCLDIAHIVSIDEVLHSPRFAGWSDEERMERAFHWSNLMPLITAENLAKGNKLNPLQEWINGMWLLDRKCEGGGLKT